MEKMYAMYCSNFNTGGKIFRKKTRRTKMRKVSIILSICGFAVLFATMGNATLATTINYDVSPSDLATALGDFSPPAGTGTNPFAYDWDSAPPNVGNGAPAGYGDSSFAASVVQTGANAADRYRAIRISLTGLFGGSVKVQDLAGLSYYTEKGTPASGVDWRANIYTTPEGNSGDRDTWYRNRIQSLPYGSLNLNAPADQWNLWSTDSGDNQLRFGANRTGFTTENILWSDLAAGSVTRGSYTWDFSNEEIMWIDIILGANSNGGTASSQIDGVKIELVNGSVADINLVPEPGTLVLIGMGLVSLLFYRRRRLK
jgi:hypothetical protein